MKGSQARGELKVLQLNVHGCEITHTLLLQTALSLKYDVICVQEPYVAKDLTLMKTAWIQAYTTFAPQPDWRDKPWTMTYARKEIEAEQVILDSGNRDLVVIKIRTTSRDVYVANIYNQCDGAAPPNRRGLAIEQLKPFIDGKRMLLVGDFNMHSHLWDTNTVVESPDAEDFCSWLDESGASVVSEADVPTFRTGSVLDLAIASRELIAAAGCESRVRADLDCGSDHTPVSTVVGTTEPRFKSSPGRYKMDKMDRELFCKALRAAADSISFTSGGRVKTPDELDAEANQLVDLAIAAVDKSTPKSQGKGFGKRWWNKTCGDSVRVFRRARRKLRRHPDNPILLEDFRKARREHKRAIRKARKSYWRKVMGELRDPKDLFRAVKWHSAIGRHNLPPLEHEGTTTTTAEEQATMLLDYHIQPSTTEATATPPAAPVNQQWPVRGWLPFSEAEVHHAISKPANTAPGPDGISNSVWKLTWEVLKGHITAHFNNCVRSGYHPKRYRTASLVVIRKPGRNPKSPRSYRLISLLSTLGKGIERVVARRMAMEAIHYGIIPVDYAGAVPHRSAEDLTLKLADKIQSGLESRLKTSFLTFDVKGAFDAVKKERLLRRLADQGWSRAVVTWVRSFLTDRRVTLTVNGLGSAERETGGSLPQGSPISPILFMLFLAPLMTSNKLLGYADDGCIVEQADRLETNLRNLQRRAQAVAEWCFQNELELDWDKTGLMHCYRGRLSTANLSLTLPDGSTLEPSKSIKWLGVHYDRLARGGVHAAEAAKKARRSVNGIKVLAGVFHGAPCESLMLAARGCVLPQLTYGAAAWCTTLTKTAMSKLEVCWRSALRAIMPIYRTTRKELVHHFSAAPPMELVLLDKQRAAAIRASTADTLHPLHRSKTAPNGTCQRLKALLPGRIAAFPTARVEENQKIKLPPKISKEEAAAKHIQALARMHHSILRVYTDGSRDDEGNTGAGWVVYQGNRLIASGHGACGKLSEVADAEALAALHGMRDAVRLAPNNATDLFLFIDNYSVVQRIAGEASQRGTSAHIIKATRELLLRWKGTAGGRQLYHAHPKGRVRWVPGHCEVQGNEAADSQAKRGCKSDLRLIRDNNLTLAAALRWKKETLSQDFRTYLDSPDARRKHLQNRSLLPPKAWDLGWIQGLNRAALGRVLAARSGHGDFAEYHQKFRHEDADLLCRFCEAEKSPTHPWTCQNNQKRFSERFIKKLLLKNRSSKWLATKLENQWKQYHSPRPTAD